MTATEKQVRFIKSLFADAEKGFTLAAEQGRSDLVSTLTAKVAAIQPILVNVVGNVDVDKRDASLAINVLKDVADSLRSLVMAATTPPGIARLNPVRVIDNRFGKSCSFCDAYVDAGEGFAAQQSSKVWLTVCQSCANETSEEREARLAAERAERQAKVDAERAARDAALVEEQNHRAYVEAFALDLFARAGADDAVKPDIHVAIPSATGNNDLDFFRVMRVNRSTAVYRVIGGHNDQRLSLAQAEAAMLALVLTDDIPAAMATYGREIGRCGYCHRHLTDEESRAVGLGPVCAAKYGW